ncbi:ML domain-containing protein [Mycena floridula]|nr:ML domain-containing protein [Mycena floridula]
MLRVAFLSLFLVSSLSHISSTVSAEQIALSGGARIEQSWSYTVCPDLPNTVEITSIKVSPDPPKPGQNLTVTVSAEVLEPIEEGAYADVVVKLGLIKLLTKTFDICEEARNANASVQCPVGRGHYTIQETVALPKEIPPAKFTVDVQGYTNKDERLVCLKILVNFAKGLAQLAW